jgi:hypothetical protein
LGPLSGLSDYQLLNSLGCGSTVPTVSGSLDHPAVDALREVWGSEHRGVSLHSLLSADSTGASRFVAVPNIALLIKRMSTSGTQKFHGFRLQTDWSIEV